MQDGKITSGKNKGKRVNEMGAFRAALSSSPQHYSATIRSRSDMAPDVIESGMANATARLKKPVSYETAAAGSEDYYAIEEERLKVALDRLTPEALQSSHYGLFQDIQKVADARIKAGKVKDSTILPDLLQQKMEEFIKSGTIGANAVGSLRGGSEQHVDRALARSSKPRDLKSFFP